MHRSATHLSPSCRLEAVERPALHVGGPPRRHVGHGVEELVDRGAPLGQDRRLGHGELLLREDGEEAADGELGRARDIGVHQKEVAVAGGDRGRQEPLEKPPLHMCLRLRVGVGEAGGPPEWGLPTLATGGYGRGSEAHWQ